MFELVNDSKGQTSLDFIAGIGIFLSVFLFVFTFIPGMLTPFQSNSDELTMVADRAGITLVQNVLIDHPENPNIISEVKLNDMISQLNGPGSLDYRKNTLGIDSTARVYSLNVTMVKMSGEDYKAGPECPEGTINLGQSRRVVLTDSGAIGVLVVKVW